MSVHAISPRPPPRWRYNGILLLTLAVLCAAPAFATQDPFIYTVAGGGPHNVPAVGYTRLWPHGVAVAPTGDVYLSNGNRVYRVDKATGLLTIYAGGGGGDDGGPADKAILAWPIGLALDPAGNLFIADNGAGRIRRVDATTRLITTVALVSGPWGIVVDGGDLLVTSQHRVVRIEIATGVVTPIAGIGSPGFGGDGGQATSALLDNPTMIAIGQDDSIFVADTENGRIRRVDAVTGVITTIAGTGNYGYGGDGGPATAANFIHPTGLAFDAGWNLFIADYDSQDGDGSWHSRVRRVDAVTGIISRVVGGRPTYGSAGDGGPAIDSLLFYPEDIEIDASGNLYIADTGEFFWGTKAGIRRVDAVSGIIRTIAGGDDRPFAKFPIPATNARLGFPTDVAYDAAGNLYIVDADEFTLKRVDAVTGNITTIVDNTILTGDPGLWNPHGVAVLSSGVVLVANTGLSLNTSYDRVVGVTPQGAVGTFLGDTYLSNPYDVEVDSANAVLIADTYHHRVLRVPVGGPISVIAGTGVGGYGGDGGPGAQALLSFPIGIGVDDAGNVYIAEEGNVRIRRVDAATGVITTVAGTGVAGFAGDGGPATAALLSHPTDVDVEPDGSLLIIDEGNSRIRRVDAATGIITTIVGTGVQGFAGDGGPASQARVSWNYRRVGLAPDGAGGFAFADTRNGRIRWVTTQSLSAGTTPDGARVPGTPLRVTAAAGGDITLTWGDSCVRTDDDYAIYEGTLGNYTSHAPRMCSTGGARGVTLTPAADDAYYLVVPIGGAGEGSYGFRSDGTQRSPAAAACFPQSIGPCAACGDGVATLPESCDVEIPPAATCGLFAYDGGSIACTSSCALDTSGCTDCGDGVREGQEQCDGSDLGGQTCVGLGLGAGTLGCNATCAGFDLSGCGPICGDGWRTGSEVCDGADLGGQTCVSRGFDGGALACALSCTAFDESACTDCGDSIREGGEQCDGSDLGGQTCAGLGYDGGTLTCETTCAFNRSQCRSCGNGARELPEVCDGPDLGGATCQTQGFTSGTLLCNATCTALNTSGCSICGNNHKEGAEVCDGTDLGGQTCMSQGYPGGTLRCLPGCNAFRFDECWF